MNYLAFDHLDDAGFRVRSQLSFTLTNIYGAGSPYTLCISLGSIIRLPLNLELVLSR